MSALAEQIAREHPPQKVSQRHYVMCAACAQVFTLDGYGLHIATVTERAVRERIAADIEAEANRRDPDEEDWPSDPSEAITAAGLRIAARIVRGSKDG